MAASLTNYTELQLLNHLFGHGAFSQPDLYLALGFGAADSGAPWTEGGTGGTEPSAAAGYSRQLVNAWNVSTAQSVSPKFHHWVYTANTNAVTFGPSTANWGTSGLTFNGAIFDAATGGNCLATFDPQNATAAPMVSGRTLTFAAGEMRWYFEDIDDNPALFVPKVFATSLKKRLLEHLFRVAGFLAPTSFYLGLTHSITFLNNPETYTEFSGGGYARVNMAGSWGAAATGADGRGEVQNTAAINFPVATASWTLGSPGLYRLTLFDAASGGNVLMWFKDPANELPNIASGDRLVVPANYLQVHVD